MKYNETLRNENSAREISVELHICPIVSTQRQQLHIIAVLKTCVSKIKTSVSSQKTNQLFGIQNLCPARQTCETKAPSGFSQEPLFHFARAKMLVIHLR